MLIDNGYKKLKHDVYQIQLTMIALVTILIFAVPTGAQLVCPRSLPSLVLSLPEIDPCRAHASRTGDVKIRTPNAEAYITSATLVYQEECHSQGTYYFFGVRTCEKGCRTQSISEIDARALWSGFCPVAGKHHIRFNASYGEIPECRYTWPVTTTLTTTRCHKITGFITYTHLGKPYSNLGQVSDCDYHGGVCQLSTYSWMFWDVDERSSSDFIETEVKGAVCDGHRIWLPDRNIGFGLMEDGCEWSGYRKTYEGTEISWKPQTSSGNMYTRNKRSTSDQLLSINEYIIGELTLKASSFCQTMLGVVPASNLIQHTHPSQYARMLLNHSDLVAISHGSGLFIWYCNR